MKKKLILTSASTIALGGLLINSVFSEQITKDSPIGRAEFEFQRLKDPVTNIIPSNIKIREKRFASSLPQSSGKRSSSSQFYKHIGPYNVGGRTRAIAVDVSNTNIYFAGGVSGGMWRTTDQGQNWTRVSDPNNVAAVSCIAQDTRTGKQDIWYYGSGEVDGNSASKSFSANYTGEGVFKSTDGGQTWNILPSTQGTVSSPSQFNGAFTILVDHTQTTKDVVLVATTAGIRRSEDGGQTWTLVLGNIFSNEYSDLEQTPSGTFYATMDSQGSKKGLFTSNDGITWTKINFSGFPNNYSRIQVKVAPSDENQLYILATTPNQGKNNVSLWHYNISTSTWSNRSSNLPDGGFYTNISTFEGYCQVLAIKPDNPNVVFVGGTNLFRSNNGFTSQSQTRQIGGYLIDGDPGFNTRSGEQHPDEHAIFFHPSNPETMLSSSDGGVHKTTDCDAFNIQWSSLNNGYVTTQFYGIAIDQATSGSEVIVGGLQDNGSFWTNSHENTSEWKSVRGGDGGIVAISDGGKYYYLSTQYASIIRAEIEPNTGTLFNSVSVHPSNRQGGQGSGFLFTHPFTLDEANTNLMYLPYQNEVWRNNDLAGATWSNNSTDLIATLSSSANITAIASSKNIQGTVYVGNASGEIFRIDNAHQGNSPTVTEVTNNIKNKGYTVCIEVHPQNPNKAIVVYSNYNTRSLWYTEDSGDNWVEIEGNLRGTDDNVPAIINHLGDGPSIRWAEFVIFGNKERVALGTSVGLFMTDTLTGDTTKWVQQGASTIGNVVVDMVKFREADGQLVIGTHGNGIYTTTIKVTDTGGGGSTGIADQTVFENSINLSVYPNPAVKISKLSFNLPESNEVKIKLLDQNGKTVRVVSKGILRAGEHNFETNIEGLTKGIYFYHLNGDRINMVRKVIVN